MWRPIARTTVVAAQYPSGEVSLPFQNTSISGSEQIGLVGFLRTSVGILTLWNVPAGTFHWTTTATAVGKLAGTDTASVRAGAQTIILAFVTP